MVSFREPKISININVKLNLSSGAQINNTYQENICILYTYQVCIL